MENLLKRIKDEALISRKEKDSFRSNTLLTLWSEAAMVGKNNGNRESTDEEVLKVITRFKKGVSDTISILSIKISTLEKELSIYDEVLPEQLSEEQLREITRFKEETSETISILSRKISILEKELSIYNEFLPKQLTEEELRKILENWKETNYPDVPNMGGYMAALKRCYDGQYDGKMASAILKELL
jgi:uncharacterized protein YqeY